MTARFVRPAAWLLLVSGAVAQVPGAASTQRAAAAQRSSITQGITGAKLERVAPNRGTLTVTTRSEAGDALRLLDASGSEVSATRARDGTLKADIDPQRGYILAPPPVERRALPREGMHFPARYVTFSPAGATNLGGLFLRPSVVPLTWNEQARAYATDLFVGYEFEDGREITLPTPRTVTFFAEGANARIQADTITVRRSGGAGYQRVVLSTGQLEGETHFTARVSAADELKSSVTVLREPGGLKLSLPSTELPAFGVGSGELSVTLMARDGFPFATPKPLEVSLTSRGLRQPGLLIVQPGKSVATVDVRTTGYGAGEITAQSGGFRATVPVSLVFPTAAIVAAVLGGGLGGGARFLRNRRKGGSLLARRVMEGMIVSVIVVGAAWAGLVTIDVSTGALGTPFGAFVLGALGGYLGCVVLDRIAKKTFGGAKSEA
jgi:hypothetical protein